jgi:hypothetical protein
VIRDQNDTGHAPNDFDVKRQWQEGVMNIHVSDLTWEKLSALIRVFGGSGGRPDDDHPIPDGPWGPVIRIALDSVDALNPQPEPWNARISGAALVALTSLLNRHPEIWERIGGGFGGWVSLNPQPLPPRTKLMTAIAKTVISRAEFMHEVALAMQSDGEARAIIIVSGYVKRFTDDWCAPPFKPRFPVVVPEPHPHWAEERIDGADLIILGATFDQSARRASDETLREAFSTAARTFAEAGMARLA